MKTAGSAVACIVLSYVLGMFSFTRDNFMQLPRNLTDLDKMIFIYSTKLHSQISISLTFVIIMITIAIISVIYLFEIYGTKVGSSWLYSCVATLFIDLVVWDFFVTILCKLTNCKFLNYVYKFVCTMKISKMYSYDGWICSKQEPGRKYLERIREVTVNEMLGIDKNLLQRDDYGNLIYKNPLAERRKKKMGEDEAELAEKEQERIKELQGMEIEDIERMDKIFQDKKNMDEGKTKTKNLYEVKTNVEVKIVESKVADDKQDKN